MVSGDLNLLMSNDGGDIMLVGRDLSVIYGWQNMPLIALFGGNVAQSTPKLKAEGEQDFSFWGNNLFHPNDPQLQFNSLTERMLMNVNLSSAGRLQIEQAIKEDLAFMQAFAIITVDVQITGVDRIRITLRFQKPDKLQEQVYVFIWNATTGSITYEAPPTQNYLGTEGGSFITTESGELISLW